MIEIHPLKILIVEDNARSQIGLTAMLGRFVGLSIETAETVQEARELLDSSGAPDVILLDLDLPSEPGEALFPTIAALNKPHPRIIVASGHPYPERFDKLLEQTPKPYTILRKPYHRDDLLSAIAGDCGRLVSKAKSSSLSKD